MTTLNATPRPLSRTSPLGTGPLFAIGGAALAAIAFFLPWVTYQQATYSGFSLATSIAPALESVKAGGLKGFNLALHAVPTLAVISIAFASLSLIHRGQAGETRERTWAATAAIAALIVVLLFAASALLGGTPGGQFSPGLIRTDAAVKATVGTTLQAGAFDSLGIGVPLALAGCLLAILGNLFRRGDTAAAPRSAWRTADYVLLAIFAIVFGALYWWWIQPYAAVVGLASVVPLAAQGWQEAVFAVWFLAGLLGGYVIRRPGAAFLAETLAALAEVLLGAPAGPVLIMTGMMQALGPELVFAATGYRRWGWPVMLLAGLAAGLVALPWNWFRLGYFALDPTLLVGLLVIRLIGGAVAGGVAKGLGDALASMGALSGYAVGRERVREV